MYLTLIVLPLLGSIIAGFFGRKIGTKGSHIITCSCIIITTILAIFVFIEVGLNNIPVSIYLFRWIDSESLNISWGFNFDSLTVSMLIPVLIVSSLVHIYSIGYMSHDPHNQRFFSYLSLFTFMMIILVTADNLLLMFVGWEGVGICSYLLISFWFTRIAANQSSMSAFLTNRVGDCLLTIGMFIILWSFGNINYGTIFSLAPFMNENIITLIGICLLIGAMAKSSQVGLHVWLPQAMEGPTPVSALIHAATMVTAGVYLLMRTSPLIEYSSTVLILCLWIGAITTVFSSLIGLFQQDIKKVIAYSTMSQLGMMVIAIGLSSYNVALFHLINHAFYKGLLFLGAGAVIHAVADNQDFRKYGGLRAFLPLTYSVMLIASLSLVAIPFMTGFYSKDFILESAYGQFYLSSITVYFIATIGAMFTTLYSVKVLYLTFLANPNGTLIDLEKAEDSPLSMSIPLIILALFSIFFGYMTKDIFIGLGSSFFEDNSIFIHPNHEIMLDTEFAVPRFFKLLPLMLTISLTFISIILSEFYPKWLINFKFSNLGYNIFGFLNQRFLIELFYNKYITGIVLKLGSQTTKIIDKGAVELLGPYGLEKSLLKLSNNINSLSTGVVTFYALYILIGFIFYILFYYFSLYNNNLLILILFSLLECSKPDVWNSIPAGITEKIKIYLYKFTRKSVKHQIILFISACILRYYLSPYFYTLGNNNYFSVFFGLICLCIVVRIICIILKEFLNKNYNIPIIFLYMKNGFNIKSCFFMLISTLIRTYICIEFYSFDCQTPLRSNLNLSLTSAINPSLTDDNYKLLDSLSERSATYHINLLKWLDKDEGWNVINHVKGTKLLYENILINIENYSLDDIEKELESDYKEYFAKLGNNKLKITKIYNKGWERYPTLDDFRLYGKVQADKNLKVFFDNSRKTLINTQNSLSFYQNFFHALIKNHAEKLNISPIVLNNHFRNDDAYPIWRVLEHLVKISQYNAGNTFIHNTILPQNPNIYNNTTSNINIPNLNQLYNTNTNSFNVIHNPSTNLIPSISTNIIHSLNTNTLYNPNINPINNYNVNPITGAQYRLTPEQIFSISGLSLEKSTNLIVLFSWVDRNQGWLLKDFYISAKQEFLNFRNTNYTRNNLIDLVNKEHKLIGNILVANNSMSPVKNMLNYSPLRGEFMVLILLQDFLAWKGSADEFILNYIKKLEDGEKCLDSHRDAYVKLINEQAEMLEISPWVLRNYYKDNNEFPNQNKLNDLKKQDRFHY